MPPLDLRTANFDLPLIDTEHELEVSRLRINEAVTTISLRLQEIINQTQSPDAGTLGGQDLAFVLSLANAIGVLPLSKGGTGATTAEGIRTSMGFDAAWDAKLAAALSVAPAALDTFLEIVAEIQNNDSAIAAINTVIAGKAAQTALDAIDGRVATAEAELDVLLPSGAASFFQLPRLTTTERTALTGMADGSRIWNTTTGQEEIYTLATTSWGPASSGGLSYETGDNAVIASNVAPDGWTLKGYAGSHFPSTEILRFTGGKSFGLRLSDRYFASVGQPSTDGASFGALIDTNDFSVTIMPGLTSDWRADTFVPVANGKLLILGGVNWYGSTIRNWAAIYDPATNTLDYAGTANMPAGRRGCIAVPLLDGRVAVLGGYTTWNSALASSQRQLWIYDPVANSWSTLVASMTPYFYKSYGGMNQYDADTLLIAGGHGNTGGTQNNVIYMVDLTTGAVTSKGTHTGLAYNSIYPAGIMNLDGTQRGYVQRAATFYSVDKVTSELIVIPAPMSASDGTIVLDDGRSFYRLGSTTLVQCFTGILIQKD